MKKLIKTFDCYDVVTVPFPFSDKPTSKIRPALILSSAKNFNAKLGVSIVAMITSLKPDKDLWPTDIIIKDLSSAGLPAASIVRFKIFTLDHTIILETLGSLSDSDRQQTQQRIQEIFFFSR